MVAGVSSAVRAAWRGRKLVPDYWRKTMPVATLPPIKGLLQVGGHGRGDALFCFDKPAFCSYGLKQSANAPVSAESIDAVKAALDHLMSSETLSPTLAGMRFVHWFDSYVPAECDPTQQALDGDSKNQEAEQQTEDDDGYDDDEEFDETVEAPSNPDAERDIAAKRIESIESGAATTAIPASTQYYILLLSGVQGASWFAATTTGITANWRRASSNGAMTCKWSISVERDSQKLIR